MTLKEYKEKLRPYKQGYVAEKINVTQCYLSQVINGKLPMSKKVEKALNEFINQSK